MKSGHPHDTRSSPKPANLFAIILAQVFGGCAISTIISEVPPLEQIQKLSDERQRLWRGLSNDGKQHVYPITGRPKITDDGAERIKQINLKLKRLWAVYRNEIAAEQVWVDRPTDRLHLPLFDDFRSRFPTDDGEMRVQVGDDNHSHWAHIEHAIPVRQGANNLKKQTQKRAIAPKKRPDLRKNAALPMLQ